MTDPNDLVGCLAGYHFGQIDDSIAQVIGRPAGPICLPYGVPGHSGFGLRHIETATVRMKSIQALGYDSVVSYAYFVCGAFDWITAGDRDRLILVRIKEPDHHTVIVQHNPGAGHWAITTCLPKRNQRGERLWERMQAGESESSPGVVEIRPRFETLTLRKKL